MKKGSEQITTGLMGDVEVKVKCPYCSTINVVRFKKNIAVLACEIEDGGCDKTFLTTMKKQINWLTRKIEGEE